MRFSIRTKLLAAFAIDLLLLMALGTFAARQMSVMSDRALFVEEYTIPSLDRVAQIDSVIQRYRALQLEYIVYTNDADKDRIEQNMADLEQEMSTYIDDYKQLVLTTDDAEQTQLVAVEQVWRRLVETNQQRFIPATRLNNTGTVQPAFTRMNPLYNELAAASQQLATESQTQATEALTVVRSTFETSRYVIILDTVLAIILSATIGLVLSARIANRVGRLTGATVEVAAGDFERTLRVVSNDELGVLATNFNQMVDSLRGQRQALEQRNDALQHSLERQQQLMHDLVLREQSEAAATRARAAAEAASQAKSMFLATMSHELRTPLTAIIGYAQLLHLRAVQDEHGTQTTELDRILSAGRHLTTVINNVLDFSKIEQGKVDLTITVFDISILIADVVAIIEPLVEQGDNTLAVLCPTDSGTMQADVGKVRQVLFNLLSNAAKFTHEGDITLTVVREHYGDDEWVQFAIADTGIGITREQLPRLFRPFSQVDESTTRKYGGTGLGLALSRQLCQHMGGDILVESVAGVGSTFMVYLPVVARYGRQPTAQSGPLLQYANAVGVPQVQALNAEVQ